MSIAALIRNMAAAGAPPEAIALAVEAIEGAKLEIDARRAAEAARTRRYRERGGGAISEELRQAVMERDGYVCCDCGSGDYLQCDHVIPVSRGGEATLENLQALCRVCNARKRDRVRKSDVRGNSKDSSGSGADTPLEQKVSPGPPSKTQSPYTPSDPKGSSVPTILRFAKSNGFERFWEAYPSKVGKRDALKAYDRALKRIAGPDPPQTILAAVAQAKLGRRWREGIIPNPSTWLNQDRWEDEIKTDGPHERPHADPRFTAKQDNLRRAVAGAQLAAQRRQL